MEIKIREEIWDINAQQMINQSDRTEPYFVKKDMEGHEVEKYEYVDKNREDVPSEIHYAIDTFQDDLDKNDEVLVSIDSSTGEVTDYYVISYGYSSPSFREYFEIDEGVYTAPGYGGCGVRYDPQGTFISRYYGGTSEFLEWHCSRESKVGFVDKMKESYGDDYYTNLYFYKESDKSRLYVRIKEVVENDL